LHPCPFKVSLGAMPIIVNRAPVLTLWAAVVAERLGHPADTAKPSVVRSAVRRPASKPVRIAMEALAARERFRPEIPPGNPGWGAKAEFVAPAGL
jgi:hypothetical protein